MPGTTANELVSLLRQVEQSELSAQAAVERARDPTIAMALTEESAVGVSVMARELVRKNEARWRAGVILHALVNASMDSGQPEREPTVLWCEMALNWTQIVGVALWHVPDPSLYQGGLARATRAMYTSPATVATEPWPRASKLSG